MLNGEKPANTSAIRITRIPGSQWNYSSDGYLVMQQMVSDVTDKSFEAFMDEVVLKPLNDFKQLHSAFAARRRS